MSVSFLDRFRPRTALPQPVVFDGVAQVRAYWEALRQGSALPTRAALDPRGFGGILDRVFLAERIGKGLVQVNIAGSALSAFAGADLRGLPLSCLFSSGSRPLLAEAVEEVFAGPSAAGIDLGSDRGHQGQAVARLVLLPLQEEADRQPVLGVIGFAGGQRACKLQVLARQVERLHPSRPVAKPVPVTEPKPIGRHGHLRLVRFDA